MSKKNPRRPRPATPAHKRQTPASIPPLTDPHLTALLMFLANKSPSEDGCVDRAFSAALADADALLSSLPLTSAFDDILTRPCLNNQVRAATEASTGTDADQRRRLLAEIFDGEQHDADPITAAVGGVQALLWDYTGHGMVRGACLMYRLLKGGAR